MFGTGFSFLSFATRTACVRVCNVCWLHVVLLAIGLKVQKVSVPDATTLVSVSVEKITEHRGQVTSHDQHERRRDAPRSVRHR